MISLSIPTAQLSHPSPHTLDVDGCEVCHTRHTGPSALWSDTGTLELGQPDPSSQACLVCHDGTLGSDALRGRWDELGEHPVSIGFDSADLRPVRDVLAAGLPLFGEARTVECSTCHNPHGSPYDSLLRVPAELLCQACHAK